jgi:hypothetical protein
VRGRAGDDFTHARGVPVAIGTPGTPLSWVKSRPTSSRPT